MESKGKRWLIGIDEAGYGPNLGPLVVAATAWRLPAGCDLDELLSLSVSRSPRLNDERLLIADSKAVYQPGGGLARLERAVYAIGGVPSSWAEFVDSLVADPENHRANLPWLQGYNPPLPIAADRDELVEAGSKFRQVLRDSQVKTTRIAARLIYPAEFNRLVKEHGTKGAALSYLSIGLARRLYEAVINPHESCELIFDKHGGRNRYGALLQEHFPDGWIETVEESRPVSRYRVGDDLTFRFRSKGEAELPVALASMTAKLLRELSMNAFNAYWLANVPGLKPTAGYPVDAKRFKAAIEKKQAELGIAEDSIWRCR